MPGTTDILQLAKPGGAANQAVTKPEKKMIPALDVK